MLRQALVLAEADDCYQALKLARRVMRHEEEVLGLAPVPTARQGGAAGGRGAAAAGNPSLSTNPRGRGVARRPGGPPSQR